MDVALNAGITPEKLPWWPIKNHHLTPENHTFSHYMSRELSRKLNLTPEDHNLLTYTWVESLIALMGHPGRNRAEKVQRGPPTWAKRICPERMEMYGENNKMTSVSPFHWFWIMLHNWCQKLWSDKSENCWMSEAADPVRKKSAGPGQRKEQACPLLSALGSGSKVWGHLHLELEELDTQKTKAPSYGNFHTAQKAYGRDRRPESIFWCCFSDHIPEHFFLQMVLRRQYWMRPKKSSV